jgi:hypothetical protein
VAIGVDSVSIEPQPPINIAIPHTPLLIFIMSMDDVYQHAPPRTAAIDWQQLPCNRQAPHDLHFLCWILRCGAVLATMCAIEIR